MSDYIPFEIQSEIIKRFPVKSLVQFRSVSKQWKSFIDCPKFINTYHINHPNPQHHLLVGYKLNRVQTYTSIIDDNTFPQQKFPLTAPEPLNLLKHAKPLSSVDGLVCFDGWYKDNNEPKLVKMVVLWNPSVRKSVGISISNVFESGYTRIGFGICPDTNDAKLVKFNVVETPSRYWEVQVFTLSSRVWKTVYTGAPFKPCNFSSYHVFIHGIIYWLSLGSFLISFDLKSEKLGEVCLPERLVVRTFGLCVAKVNESLGLLEYDVEGGISVCGVWMRKDGVNQLFTKIHTVKFEGSLTFNRVLGFRNNGELVIETGNDDTESQIEVYEPSSGRLNNVGISGNYLTFSVSSYMETLFLLDESNDIIH